MWDEYVKLLVIYAQKFGTGLVRKKFELHPAYVVGTKSYEITAEILANLWYCEYACFSTKGT